MKIALSVSDKERAKGSESLYFKALVEAGVPPAELRLLSPSEASHERPGDFDGILFAGGADIDPKFYGETTKYASVKADPTRDESELALLDRARRARLPILGICRGLQLINVHFGGTLYQDLMEDWDTAVAHQQTPAHSRDSTTHTVTVTEPQSMIAGAIKSACQVNSMHHQAIHCIGRGLKATAYAEDGLVEAVEAAENYPFLLAVQWHPEEIADHPEQHNIFQQFVAKCREAAETRMSNPAS